jgi:uncharacterized protein (DUF2062 family)
MNLRRWLQKHSLRLLAIRDTPEAIAGGVAIGIFFWFPPVIGLKTVGAIFIAWLTRCNLIAAVIAVTLHDLLLPVMFVIYRWEYDLGYWLLSHPHHWPQRLSRANLFIHRWTDWETFLKSFSTVGKPLLLGSVLVGLPVSVISYFVARGIVARHQQKKRLPVPAKAGHIPKD